MLPSLEYVRQPHGRVAYRASGEGPALVFLHGLGGHSASWAAQLSAFARTRRVIAWDCPGYGGSDCFTEAEPDIDRYVGAAIGLIDTLGIDRLALVGHSMGGMLAPRVAARLGGRVEKLVLSCTRPSAAHREPGGIDQRIRDRETMDDAAFGRRRAEGMAAPGADATVVIRLALIAGAARMPGYGQAARMIGDFDNAAILAGIAVPTLVFVGAEDRIAPPAIGETIAGMVPGARLIRIEGAGHAPYAEKPADYNAALAGFLDQ